MIVRFRFLLVSPLLTATLSGCGTWDSWMQRVHDEPIQSAAQDDSTSQAYQIEPGHSTPDVYNENYDPYNGQYEPYGRQLQRFSPPPAPPARENDVTSELGRQPAASDAAAEDQLIRTLRTPRIFSPDSVRSIYDRIRGTESETSTPKDAPREGPIALRQSPSSSALHCGYDEARPEVRGPVRLGIPETETGPLAGSVPPQLAASGLQQTPAVIQACPSSFTEPMVADPLAAFAIAD